MRIGPACAAAALVVGLQSTADAQSCTTPNSALWLLRTCSVTTAVNDPLGAWVVNRLGQMTVNSTANLVLTPPTSAAYDANTLQEAAAVSRTVTVKANAAWNLLVAPNTVGSPSYWTGTNDPTYGAFVAAQTNKPSSDLSVSTVVGSGYLPLATTNAGSTTVLSNQPATAGSANTIYFATNWFYQFDRPGLYQLPFVFRLSIP
jgi:hypothetical protein